MVQNIFAVISCILRVRINKTSEAFSKSLSIVLYDKNETEIL